MMTRAYAHKVVDPMLPRKALSDFPTGLLLSGPDSLLWAWLCIKLRGALGLYRREIIGDDMKNENERIKSLIKLEKSNLPTDGGPEFNRLIFSRSPYLLQHAANPVDWYPWCEEAFARARAEDRPVLVSIGYATCHWCHVMEHESFEDPDVAAAMNRNCISIKVDREERPDIDEHYMLAAQMMTGSGGWPLNVIMTPDREPFFAATYLPKHSRGGFPGIIELMDRIGELWRTDRPKIMESCKAIAEALARMGTPVAADLPGQELLAEGYRQVASLYDREFGGFGQAPKFPMPMDISFLLRIHHRSGLPEPLEMVEHSLRAMRAGGIYDQLGFGFHRYSVDLQWLVPHFEKMLYDQALIAFASIEAYQATGDNLYRQTATEIFDCAFREFGSPEGGFYSAEDADSEGAEGTFYLWTPGEIRAVLGDDAGTIACALYGVTEEGNFEGKNILHLSVPLNEFARRIGVIPELLAADMERWRGLLHAAREGRVRPFRDEKILTGWNGLMIAALARGYAATGEMAWLNAAERAAWFIRQHLLTAEGRLLRSYNVVEASIPGFLEDYAFYVWGLIELHQATLEEGILADALRFSREMLRLFDAEEGGLYDVGFDAEQLPVRMRSANDGVIPSGASVAALNLLRLSRIADDEELTRKGEALLRSHMGSVVRQPASHHFFLIAFDFALMPRFELHVSGGTAVERDSILRAVGRRFIPSLSIRSGAAEGPMRVGICAGGTCRPPVAGVDELERLLDELLNA